MRSSTAVAERIVALRVRSYSPVLPRCPPAMWYVLLLLLLLALPLVLRNWRSDDSDATASDPALPGGDGAP